MLLWTLSAWQTSLTSSSHPAIYPTSPSRSSSPSLLNSVPFCPLFLMPHFLRWNTIAISLLVLVSFLFQTGSNSIPPLVLQPNGFHLIPRMLFTLESAATVQLRCSTSLHFISPFAYLVSSHWIAILLSH